MRSELHVGHDMDGHSSESVCVYVCVCVRERVRERASRYTSHLLSAFATNTDYKILQTTYLTLPYRTYPTSGETDGASEPALQFAAALRSKQESSHPPPLPPFDCSCIVGSGVERRNHTLFLFLLLHPHTARRSTILAGHSNLIPRTHQPPPPPSSIINHHQPTSWRRCLLSIATSISGRRAWPTNKVTHG